MAPVGGLRGRDSGAEGAAPPEPRSGGRIFWATYQQGCRRLVGWTDASEHERAARKMAKMAGNGQGWQGWAHGPRPITGDLHHLGAYDSLPSCRSGQPDAAAPPQPRRLARATARGRRAASGLGVVLGADPRGPLCGFQCVPGGGAQGDQQVRVHFTPPPMPAPRHWRRGATRHRLAPGEVLRRSHQPLYTQSPLLAGPVLMQFPRPRLASECVSTPAPPRAA